MTFTNAAAYEFTPEEGKSRLLEDKGEEKLFEITLPTTTPEEPVPVLVYKGPVPAGMEPCSAKAHSSREEAVTSAVGGGLLQGQLPLLRGHGYLRGRAAAGLQRHLHQAHGRKER